MIRSAAKIGLDFSKAEPHGRLWWLKVKWILDELERESERDLISCHHSQHVSALNYLAGEKAFKLHWTEAEKNVKKLFNSYHPWLKEKMENSSQNEGKRWMEKWMAEFGDLKDEKTQKKIKDAKKEWRQIIRESELETYGKSSVSEADIERNE